MRTTVGVDLNYRKYIASHRWRTNDARLIELSLSCGHCRLCFELGSPGSPLEVHHATYNRLGNETIGDLIALCGRCHHEVETFLRRRRFADRTPPRTDFVSLRDRRRPLVDPTR
jgi:5-methylcytosine-specific restriction endonuclease McrA